MPGTLETQAPRTAAWLSLLRAHAELKRTLETQLTARHGLSLSAYELLSRLAHAEGGHLRMTDLAEQIQLSLSRVSRLMDQLERDGLVCRRSCPGDSRAVHATIEPPGRKLSAAAQATFSEVLEERFLGRLDRDEVEQLSALLGRLAGTA